VNIMMFRFLALSTRGRCIYIDMEMYNAIRL